MGVLQLFTGYFSWGIMTRTLGLFLLLLPLAAPLIAQDTRKMDVTLETNVCEYYNETCANSEEECPIEETCNLAKEKKGCSVTWTNSTTDGVTVVFKGCIYFDTTCTDKTQCISEELLNATTSISAQSYYYCCCFGSNCNREFSWRRPAFNMNTTNPPIRISTNIDWRDAMLLIMGGLFIILIITPIVFYYYRRKKLANFMELPTIESSALNHRCRTSPCLSKRPIQLLEVKARGRFGAVWKAKYCTTEIAVKIFPVQDKESWMLEKQIFSLPQMRHENLLQFIGVEERGEKFNSEFWLITAYHDHGSLYDYLKTNVFTWDEVCHIGESMARGLAFLHSEQPSTNKGSYEERGLKPAIAHRDFKSKNVLLKSDLTACVADFGLAITFYPGKPVGETHGQVGTRRYMAPEILEGSIAFHRDSFLPIDMYACSLVLWEIISRCSVQDGPIGEHKLPFEEYVGQHPTLDDMQECVVTLKNRPTIPNTWLPHQGLMSVVQMMQESWDHDAEARLSASCIVERFAALSKQNIPSFAS